MYGFCAQPTNLNHILLGKPIAGKKYKIHICVIFTLNIKA
jgi:hypothetical protein